MKTETKLYFRNIDSNNVETIEDIWYDGVLDGLKEITVLEADLDKGISEYIWCQLYDCVERDRCKKSLCHSYESKSGRGKCKNKGNLYLHGKEVTFKI